MINPFVIVRLFIGSLLVFASTQKLFSPYQNFLYIVESYQIFPATLSQLIVFIFPWIEFFLGVFLILGLWLTAVLRGTVLVFLGFIFIVAQALIRKLSIADCGCFGEWFSLPLYGILTVDSLVLLMTIGLLLNIPRTSQWSLDRYFDT